MSYVVTSRRADLVTSRAWLLKSVRVMRNSSSVKDSSKGRVTTVGSACGDSVAVGTSAAPRDCWASERAAVRSPIGSVIFFEAFGERLSTEPLGVQHQVEPGAVFGFAEYRDCRRRGHRLGDVGDEDGQIM